MMVEGVEAIRRCRRGHHSAIIGVSDHIASYLKTQTIGITGTRHAKRHESLPADRARHGAASRTSRPGGSS
jgi:hypothetical protein